MIPPICLDLPPLCGSCPAAFASQRSMPLAAAGVCICDRGQYDRNGHGGDWVDVASKIHLKYP